MIGKNRQDDVVTLVAVGSTLYGSLSFAHQLYVNGRIESGKAVPGMAIHALGIDGKEIERGRITKVLAFRGLKRQPIDGGAEAGDIVAIAGLSKATVADTLCALEVTEALPAQPIDPPTISMTVSVNDSPLAGREGDKVQSRVIRDRLLKEAEANVAIRVTETGGKDAFEVANQLFRRIRGGLGVATVAANALFAALTGSSIASAAVFSRVAVPQMLRFGYQPRFAVGVVAGSSVLGMLIPPSLLMILYGFLSNQSVGDLFTAGIVPGLLLAVAYAVMIVLMATFKPDLVKVPGAQVPGLDVWIPTIRSLSRQRRLAALPAD
jgi:hypothetical protein